MAMDYDRRLLLRVILLILNALGYLYQASAPAPVYSDDTDRHMHFIETNSARQNADINIRLARDTFALILRQADKTLDQLAHD